MAVFYKYEYTHKTKNIHPCVIVEVVDLVIRRAADVMEEPCISLAVCEVGGEVVDRLAVAPLVERAVVSWAVKGHLGVDNIRWLLLLDVWVAGSSLIKQRVMSRMLVKIVMVLFIKARWSESQGW